MKNKITKEELKGKFIVTIWTIQNRGVDTLKDGNGDTMFFETCQEAYRYHAIINAGLTLMKDSSDQPSIQFLSCDVNSIDYMEDKLFDKLFN